MSSWLESLDLRNDLLAALRWGEGHKPVKTRILMAGARPGDYPDAWARRRAT